MLIFAVVKKFKEIQPGADFLYIAHTVLYSTLVLLVLDFLFMTIKHISQVPRKGIVTQYTDIEESEFLFIDRLVFFKAFI